jgi:hypothetical protein
VAANTKVEVTMFKSIRYYFWKRKAKKAVAAGLTAKCCACNDPIVPGDFVGTGVNKKNRPILVHSGFHFSLSKRDAFCETGAIGTGFWDGHQVQGTGESLAAKALRTHEIQIG